MKRTPPSVVLLAVLLGGFSVPSPAQIHRVSDEVRRADLERRSEVEQMVTSYRERRDLIVPALNALGMHTVTPRGAYYALSDVRRFLGPNGPAGSDDVGDFCERLLTEERVALAKSLAVKTEAPKAA